MNMNHSYPTTMYENILAQIYVFLTYYLQFLLFTINMNLSKYCAQKFNQKYVHFCKYTFIHCSRITVVFVDLNVFKCFSLKFTKHATVTQTETNQEVTKLTDKYAAEYSKLP